MNKKTFLSPFRRRGSSLAPMLLLLALAACTGDELMDGTVQDLPEGRYPLTLTATQTGDEAQTRVSENSNGTNSAWTDGDQIKVKITGNGNDAETTCTLNASGQVTASSPKLFWKTNGTSTITAWYPTTDIVDLANQSSDLKYVLKATATGVSYKNPVALPFAHQLAKVRVVFSDQSIAGISNAAVSILAPTTCTNNKGEVTAGSTTSYIPMRKTTYNSKVCYEVNVTPNLVLSQDAFQLIIEGKTLKCSTSKVTTQAAQLHIITLTVNEKAKEVNVSDISGTKYTVSGNILLKGKGQSKDLQITMESGAKLTLDNVVLNSNGDAITCKGDATITLNGANSINSTNIGICVNAGTLTINGDDNSSLTVKGNGHMQGAGIGAIENANITINGGHIIANKDGVEESTGIGSAGWDKRCGTITINGGIIESWGGGYSAGIGGSNSGPCGDIIITGGDIKAYGGGGSPGIGCGDDGACNDITITGGTIVATKGLDSPSSIGACKTTKPTGKVTIDRNNANVTEN